jgi:chromosome segregation ATPase
VVYKIPARRGVDLMAGFGGAVKLTGANEYKKALSDITQNLKVVSAEMKATSSSFDAGDKSEQELIEASNELNKTLETQRSALAVLKSELNSMTSEYTNNKAKHEELLGQYDSEKEKLENIRKSLGEASSEYQSQKKVVD